MKIYRNRLEHKTMGHTFVPFPRPRPTLCLVLLTCCLALGPGVQPAASAGRDLVVSPLTDDRPEPQPGQLAPSGPAPDASAPPTGSDTGAAPGTASPDTGEAGLFEYREATVMAYLIELARKQNTPCPSGATPPVPPSLEFSEPLCRAAEAWATGRELVLAIADQGLTANRWRSFTAQGQDPRQVVKALRESHCEALLEPYTHIGAARTSQGWRVVMARFGEEDPPAAPSPVDSPAPTTPDGGPVPTPSAVPPLPASAPAGPDRALPSVPESPGSPQVAADLPPAATAPDAPPGADPSPAASRPMQAAPVSSAPSPEARAMQGLLNDMRAKGGMCLGKPFPPAPALEFSPSLQTAAEQKLAGGPSSGPNAASGGAKTVYLTGRSSSGPAVVLDTWLVNPGRCEALFSREFTHVGVAHQNGSWVLGLGTGGAP